MARLVEQYVNRNPFPITIPLPTGGSVVVPSGHPMIGAWYRQFTGFKQLTREEVMAEDKLPEIPIVPTPRPTLKLATTMPKIENKDEMYYIRKNGVYYCKLCEGYATGSQISMDSHLAEQHAISGEAKEPSMLDTIADRMKVSTAIPKQAVPGKEDLGSVVKSTAAFPEAPPVATSMNLADALAKVGHEKAAEMVREVAKEEIAKQAADVFPCPQCDREFRTEKGLQEHKTSKHGAAK